MPALLDRYKRGLNVLISFLHNVISPQTCYSLAGRLTPFLGIGAVVCLLYGFVAGFGMAPPDYQQGEGFRIIYVHVPSAFLSLLIYVVMASASGCFLIWRIKLADVLAQACAPLGAAFTLLALATGSIWGKPMWGTWWVWDARLSSELILLFLYLGYMALRHALSNSSQQARAVGILAVVGVVNIPIIHYSVVWWNTLHQGATLSRLAAPAIETTMLLPLLGMLAGFLLFYMLLLSIRVRTLILEREQSSAWVKERVSSNVGV